MLSLLHRVALCAQHDMVKRSVALELQADLFAEDVAIPDNVEAWTEEQLTTYFESGVLRLSRPQRARAHVEPTA